MSLKNVATEVISESRELTNRKEDEEESARKPRPLYGSISSGLKEEN